MIRAEPPENDRLRVAAGFRGGVKKGVQGVQDVDLDAEFLQMKTLDAFLMRRGCGGSGWLGTQGACKDGKSRAGRVLYIPGTAVGSCMRGWIIG